MSTLPISEEDFRAFADFFHARCGLHLGSDKAYLVRQRLGPVLQREGLDSWAALLLRLRLSGDADLVNEAVHAITTHETSFFRDQHPFRSFEDVVLPELAELVRERKARPFCRRGPLARIWTAAVSTGQEAYSLAMIVDRFVSSSRGGGLQASDLGLLATDISHQVLAQAVSGEYNEMEIKRGLGLAERDRYFRRRDGGWRVDDRLRTGIQFQVCSLIEDFRHLGAFDVVLCRNVLIYFDEGERRRVLDRIADMIDPGGLLLLGASEHIMPQHPAFVSERLGPTTWYRRVAGADRS